MRSKFILSFALSGLLVFFILQNSCIKEVGPLPRKSIQVSPTLCDSLNVKFSVDIQPIIQNQCQSGCHNAGGVAPTDYSNFSTFQSDALSGVLWQRINDGNPSI